MKTVAVICEYNPFHKGHEKQLALLRRRFAEEGEAITLLAVMSGNYVQRGEPALFEKYTRAKAALLGGADLVVELPYPYSAAPADRFAEAGVHLAGRLGADILAFGSESLGQCGEAALLQRLSEVASFRDQGGAVPAEREDRALSTLRGETRRFEAEKGFPYPATPNDRLAAEYIRSLGKMQKKDASFSRSPSPAPSPMPLPREEDGLSAHRARELFFSGDMQGASALLPARSAHLYENAPMAVWQNVYSILLARLRTATSEDLHRLFDIPLEIAVRLTETAKSAASDSFEEFFASLQNKNDTAARLRRSLLTALFQVTPDDFAHLPAFSLLLGANSRGRAFLRAKRREREAFSLCAGLSRAFAFAWERPFFQRQVELHFRAELFYGFFQGHVRGSAEILHAYPVLL